MTKNYLVLWEINIEADTPGEAADKAREIQLDKESAATIFEVVCPGTGEVVVVDTCL